MVGPGRLELPTSRLSGVRSNQLSYGPIVGAARRQKEPLGSRSHRSLVRGPVWASPAGDVEGKRNEDGGVPHLCSVFLNEPIGREVWRFILRKEVIQPQVPLRLPCYDFIPVADPTVACCLLAVSAQSSGKANSHDVTGGVYKARERIHRGMLIRDY